MMSCNYSADTEVKEVLMTQRAKTEFKVYNFCDAINLKLPSDLTDCSPYTWNLLPNITTSTDQVTKSSPGKDSKHVNLNNPSMFGVYCTNQCNEPNQEYCAAIAGKSDDCMKS